MTDPEQAWRELREALAGVPAPCQTLDADLWFAKESRNIAVTACGHCHAGPECLAYAEVLQPEHGVWGGEVFDGGRRRAA